MTKFVAVVNTPGYMPDGDGAPATFDTAWQAWQYLISERNRHFDDMSDGELPTFGDNDDALQEMDGYSTDNEPGVVYGTTPGYDGDHDLGLAYTVVEAEASDSDLGYCKHGVLAAYCTKCPPTAPEVFDEETCREIDCDKPRWNPTTPFCEQHARHYAAARLTDPEANAL